MSKDEIVTALREHAEWSAGNEWEAPITLSDDLYAAADLIENQQREIEALRNELYQHCGKYKRAHEGACNVCRWKQ